MISLERAAHLAADNLIDALCWNLYQLADVVGKVSDAVKARYPDVPRRAIAGLRNFYAHACEGIDVERIVGDLRRGDVADLAPQLASIERELTLPRTNSGTRS